MKLTLPLLQLLGVLALFSTLVSGAVKAKSLTTSSTSKTSSKTSSKVSTSSTSKASSKVSTLSTSKVSSKVSSSTSKTSTSPTSKTEAAVAGVTVSATILVLSTDETSSYSATSGLNAHGIPYQLVIVPSGGTTLPTLNPSSTTGNYGGIIILSEPSGLTTAQWQAMYTYQENFGVRMVRLDADPDGGADGSSFGTTGANSDSGCCGGTNVEQFVYFTNTSAFPTANLIQGATRSTIDIWHTPATITDTSTTVEIAQFGKSSDGTFSTITTAGIINTNGNRQQMVWFIEFATDWSLTSNFIMHAHINWVTRGLYVGQRRILFNTQVDDMFLETELYSPAGTWFRARPSDLDAHVAWQANLNTRLPAGSLYRMEIGHNGNGNVEYAVLNDTSGTICTPESWVEYTGTMTIPPLGFEKPVGSGTSIWPTTPGWLIWTDACLALDDLLQWFQVTANRDAFSHISHSFTHENEDNATHTDIVNEIQYNQAWLAKVGISSGAYFSPAGLIPPAITGLHNGDALQAWWDNGLRYAVGDTSQSILSNPTNEYWPLVTNVSASGFAGMTVIPRYTMPIFYDCDMFACNIVEWDDTAGGDGSMADLLFFCQEQWTTSLLGLHQDPFMFHQANLRHGDTQSYTVGPVSGYLSLLQVFVETIIQELTRLTTWPVITKIHDDVGAAFVNRMAQDQCLPAMTYTVSNNAITGVSVVAQQGWCNVPIPVTFPVPATNPNAVSEQIGSDPLTLWTTVGSTTQTFTLSKPIPL